jgi:hypothetical protein
MKRARWTTLLAAAVLALAATGCTDVVLSTVYGPFPERKPLFAQGGLRVTYHGSVPARIQVHVHNCDATAQHVVAYLDNNIPGGFTTVCRDRVGHVADIGTVGPNRELWVGVQTSPTGFTANLSVFAVGGHGEVLEVLA